MKAKTYAQLVAENKKLRKEFEELKEDLEASDQEVVQKDRVLKSVRHAALEADRAKRVHDHTIMRLMNLSKKIRKEAWDMAANCVKSGWTRDNVPSSIFVNIGIADRIEVLAEKEAGHSLDFTVQG